MLKPRLLSPLSSQLCQSLVTHLLPRTRKPPNLFSLSFSPPLSLVYPAFHCCLFFVKVPVSHSLTFKRGSSIPRMTLRVGDAAAIQLSSFVLLSSLCFLMFWEILCNFWLNLVIPFSTGTTAWVTVNFTSFTIWMQRTSVNIVVILDAQGRERVLSETYKVLLKSR